MSGHNRRHWHQFGARLATSGGRADSIRERWSMRELERQFKTALFERAVLSPPKVSPLVTQMYPDALSVFRDAYNVEFLESVFGPCRSRPAPWFAGQA
jgi:hypothetical protein